MKVLTKIFLFSFLFANLDFGNPRFAPKNEISLEKFICKYQPGSKIAKPYKCLVKYIDRSHLKIDVHGNLTEPVNSIKLLITFYYKYSIYHRFGGDFNINVCDALNKRGKLIPIMEWYFNKADKFTNIKHKCPYSGYVYAKVDNISIDEFSYIEMMPAGRYRIDTTVFEDDDRILFNTSTYFSISDHRVDVSYSKF